VLVSGAARATATHGASCPSGSPERFALTSIAMTASEPQGKISQLTSQTFERLAEPLRREIKVHCYRMLGSLSQAEDLVQESYLRAWRSFDKFDGESLRAWLYKIATNACLNAIESRKRERRLLPDQRGPSTTQMPDGPPLTDIVWLEPYPDCYLERIAGDMSNPEARYEAREAIHLAFVAAIQELPPRQRAVLLLCDVLGMASAEAAALLDATTASINSMLQRARETLAKRYPEGRPRAMPRPRPEQQDLLSRYIEAWEQHDVDGFVALLKEDATFTMPPWLQWYVGRETIRSFFAVAWKTCGGVRLIPTAANGQPAFAVYDYSSAEGQWNAHAIHVLTIRDHTISALTAFQPPTGPSLFPAFGLPFVLPGDGSHARPHRS
jgi:RNA polymerase sigma-70 factor, ECF subfamily